MSLEILDQKDGGVPVDQPEQTLKVKETEEMTDEQIASLLASNKPIGDKVTEVARGLIRSYKGTLEDPDAKISVAEVIAHAKTEYAMYNPVEETRIQNELGLILNPPSK